MKNTQLLNNTKKIIYKLKNLSIQKKEKYAKIGFFLFGFILLFNISIMMIYLIDSNYQFRIFNHAYVNAVLPNQDINNPLKFGIVKVKELPFEDIKVGDKIIIYDDFGYKIYWIETVMAVDNDNFTVSTSYDQDVTNTFDKDNIIGEYVKNANLFGTIYYSSSFLKGFIFITLSHGILLYVYYYLFMTKKEIDI